MHKELVIPIYDSLIFIKVTNNMLSVNKYLKSKYGITEDLSDCRGIVFNQISPKYETRLFVMLIKFDSNWKEYWNTIGHELMHLTQDILESRQIFFKKKDPNEAYAYLQGHIMSDSLDLFEKAYKKFNK